MNQESWTQTDTYLGQALLPPDEALKQALEENSRAGLPAIDVSPTQGRLLYLLAKIHAARRILELGTLGGYSTICLARALPAEGLLVTLEADPRHAAVAQRNIERAGISKKVRIVTGLALDSLPRLKSDQREPFDLVFIDADKPNTLNYYRHVREMTRPGSVIIVDNAVRKGEVANPASTDPSVQGMRRFIEFVGADKTVEATALQTVGSKGYDGFVIARVL